MNSTNATLLSQIEATLSGPQNRASKRRFVVLFKRLIKLEGLPVNKSTHPRTHAALAALLQKVEAHATASAS